MASDRLRWLIVLFGVVAIAIVELVSDTVLDKALPFPIDLGIVVATVLIAAWLLSKASFREIDRLARALRQRNEELEARNAVGRALHRISVAGAMLSDSGEILRMTVDSARQLLGADVALLVLLGPDGQPGLRATSGPADSFTSQGDPGVEGYVRFVRPGTLSSWLAAPLLRGNQEIGTLAVGTVQLRSFKLDEVETLASLAHLAAIAIENARLQAQVRELAVQGERERIAREMHDGLAQVLAYVSAKSQAVKEFISAGQLAEAQAHLVELSGASRSIYVDVREAILGLTSPIEPDRGLVAALEEYARRFAEASKLAVRVEASPGLNEIALAPQVEAQVFRIVQEALTNVRKHAAAHRVVVALDVSERELVVKVEDDGRGLDHDAEQVPEWPRYGLQVMRDRASAIGATLDLAGRPGVGTTLRLAVPLLARR